MTTRMRADRLLVERGLFDSRTKAQAAIAAGLVTADHALVQKPSDEIAADAVLHAAPAHPYVSRGGVKLVAALDHFRCEVAGRVGLDVGASTGGFTEVLLARGARRIYAVDVGEGQLHARLRTHHQVVSLEKTDIRALTLERLTETPDFAVIDVSFISLQRVLPVVIKLLHRPAWLVALIKPQFEAGPRQVRKGIIRDARLHAAICDDIDTFVAGLGWTVAGVMPSPIAGRGGNHEFFIAARHD